MTETHSEVGRAASLISAITIGARLVGFGRTLILIWAVGVAGVATAYQNANTIPNLIFELVAGGALAALVVPLLAAPLARHRPERVRAIASALLTWAVLGLTPIAVAVAIFARPLVLLVTSESLSGDTIDTATRMLVLFAPQIPLYGIAIILTGILQAHRRFAWPALAPLLSSLTMILVYVLYAGVTGHETDVARLDRIGILILGLGTTAGVAVLACCMFVPLRGLHLRLRPRLRMETDVAADVKALAIAGAVTLGAQQLTQLLLMRLANSTGNLGDVVIFTVSQTFFLLPWAVLAVPLATAAYPSLSESHALGDTARFQSGVSVTARLVMIFSGIGVAALAGLSDPIATVLSRVAAEGADSRPHFSATLAAMAFGLFGYSLFAIYSRTLYAVGRAYAAAKATAIGWAAAAAAGIACAVAFPESDRPEALGVGWSIGMTVIGLALVVGVAAKTGRASLAGLGRAAVAALTATIASVAAARVLIAWWGHATGVGDALIQGLATGAVVLAVYVVVVAAVDARDLLRALRRRTGRIRPTDDNGDGEDQ